MSGRLEVQGIVSMKTGEPLVQFRMIDGDVETSRWQTPVLEAREMAQQVLEAAMNATYDAALVSWIKEMWPDDVERMTAGLLTAIRKNRADTWGLPDQPDDWRTK